MLALARCDFQRRRKESFAASQRLSKPIFTIGSTNGREEAHFNEL
jgi:hypothetical protein